MDEKPETGERYYALENLRSAQVRIMELTQQMVVQRDRIEACKDSNITAARDLYSQLQGTRTQLADTLSEARFPLLEAEEYQMSAIAGQLREGLLRPWQGPPADCPGKQLLHIWRGAGRKPGGGGADAPASRRLRQLLLQPRQP